MLTDGRTTDAGVTGILIAHLGTFLSGELKTRGPGKNVWKHIGAITKFPSFHYNVFLLIKMILQLFNEEH